jgi:hypothetical protein
MSRRTARITQTEADRIFKAAAKTHTKLHMRIEPDGTIDVETMGATSNTDDNQDTPDNISRLIRDAS